MLDTHDDGCDDLMKHEESFPHKTPSVQYFVVKVCLVVVFFFILHQPSPQRTHLLRF